MRVLVLTNLYPPHHYGGYEQTCDAVVRRWRAAGHDVHVACGDHRVPGVTDVYPDWVTPGFRPYWRDFEIVAPPPPVRLAREVVNHRRWTRLLDRFDPDVVSVWNHGTFSYHLLTTVQRRGVPMVLVVADNWLCWGADVDAWTRMFDPVVGGSAWRRGLGRLVSASTGVPTVRPDLTGGTSVLFASSYLAEEADRSSPFDLADTAIVAWGHDESRFRPPDGTSERPFGNRLVLVGRVEERKGTFTAVRALAHLPTFRLDLVGPASAADQRRLEAAGERSGVADRVEQRRVDADDVAGWLHRADVALFPSEWPEPFGLVGLEAMACEVPLVATGTGGSADYLRDGVNCLLVAPGDDVALADAVRRLAADPDLRRALVAGGRVTAAAHGLQRLTADLEARHSAAARSTDRHL